MTTVTFPAPETLHRGIKMALDTGEVSTIEAAERLFAGYRLTLALGPEVAGSPTLQAAVLTVVNTARRCCLGGVRVCGAVDVPLTVPWRGFSRLDQAIADLGGVLVAAPDLRTPLVVVGDPALGSGAHAVALRLTWNGWTGGVVPLADGRRLPEQQECAPAGVLAGALAVSEVFQHFRASPVAGRRAVGLSLWRPEPGALWLEPHDFGPPLTLLPSRLWLIGLGHLGQAFLWTLGFLPYADASTVLLVLQDHDVLVPANDSTSPLTWPSLVGQKKARAMAAWAEARGFRTVVEERLFGEHSKIGPDEPTVALCGVDNALARAALEDVGFEEVIEAGLGQGTREYLALQVHSLPGSRPARDRWGSRTSGAQSDAAAMPAYKELADRGMDQCGLTQLAGRVVGAPFVGTAAAALVVGELLRMCLGVQRYEILDATLRAPEGRKVVVRPSGGSPFNPGVTPSCS